MARGNPSQFVVNECRVCVCVRVCAYVPVGWFIVLETQSTLARGPSHQYHWRACGHWTPQHITDFAHAAVCVCVGGGGGGGD